MVHSHPNRARNAPPRPKECSFMSTMFRVFLGCALLCVFGFLGWWTWKNHGLSAASLFEHKGFSYFHTYGEKDTAPLKIKSIFEKNSTKLYYTYKMRSKTMKTYVIGRTDNGKIAGYMSFRGETQEKELHTTISLRLLKSGNDCWMHSTFIQNGVEIKSYKSKATSCDVKEVVTTTEFSFYPLTFGKARKYSSTMPPVLLRAMLKHLKDEGTPYFISRTYRYCFDMKPERLMRMLPDVHFYMSNFLASSPLIPGLHLELALDPHCEAPKALSLPLDIHPVSKFAMLEGNETLNRIRGHRSEEPTKTAITFDTYDLPIANKNNTRIIGLAGLSDLLHPPYQADILVTTHIYETGKINDVEYAKRMANAMLHEIFHTLGLPHPPDHHPLSKLPNLMSPFDSEYYALLPLDLSWYSRIQLLETVPKFVDLSAVFRGKKKRGLTTFKRN